MSSALLLFRETPSPMTDLALVFEAATWSLDERHAALADAWYWPEGDAIVPTLTHVVRARLKSPPEDELEHAVALTKALGELAARTPYEAIVWEATNLVHARDAWVDQAGDASIEDLPLYLWIAFRASDLGGGATSMVTRGLSTFGAQEVEIDRSTRELETILEVLTDVALVELTSAFEIEDGEAVEISAGKVRVRRAPSLRNDGTTVLRVRLP